MAYYSFDAFQKIDVLSVSRPSLRRTVSKATGGAAPQVWQLKKYELTSMKLGTTKMISLFVFMDALMTLSGSATIAGARGSKAETTRPDIAYHT